MAELTVRRLGRVPELGALLRALAGCPQLDTSMLVCLAGRWADGSVIIGWHPSRVLDQPGPDQLAVTDPELADRDGPFGGGWIGWLDYQGGGWFGYFDLVLRRDPDGGWWLESIGGHGDAELAGLAGLIEGFAELPAGGVGIESLTGTAIERHLAAVEHAISAIRAGQLYQVNICARLTGRLTGSPIDLFAAGVRALQPDYAAYLQTPARTAISFSPELFLHRRHHQIRSAPIKGTRRRDVPADRLDDPAALELLHSAKDRAENVMILDLMRNDLSRVCRPGTVRAEHLLDVRPAPGVWHLVSEVTGSREPGTGDAQLVRATFPPGSVTGAPKLRALALIDELETVPRGLFTGAIGYLSPVGDRTEFSVAIRTFELSGDQLQLGVGGGITSDSVPMLEWQECLVKAAPLVELGGARLASEGRSWPARVDVRAGVFETMLAVDGAIVALPDHLARLAASCLEIYGYRLPENLPARLRAAVHGVPGRSRLRVSVRPDADQPLIEVDPARPATVALALTSRPARAGSWRHKWADRSWLAGLEVAGALPLFGTEAGGVGETSRANVAIVAGPGLLRTPELGEDVLPGITRRRLLDAAIDHGWQTELGPITYAEFAGARLALSLSSISGVVAVGRLDGQRIGLDQRLLAELRGWLSRLD